jgi:hypothetical protein
MLTIPHRGEPAEERRVTVFAHRKCERRQPTEPGAPGKKMDARHHAIAEPQRRRVPHPGLGAQNDRRERQHAHLAAARQHHDHKDDRCRQPNQPGRTERTLEKNDLHGLAE